MFLLLFSISQGLLAQQQAWEAAETSIFFYIRNAGLEVEGKFEQVAGQFITRQADGLPVLITGKARLSDINTGIGLRDSHLQGKDYFHATKFPEIEMQMVEVNAKTIRFNVRIKGKSKVYEMPYVFKSNGKSGEFEAVFTLNRRDFEVGGRSLIMADEVKVKMVLKLKAL
ncbi:MAG: YceI family protein [Bacteroidia bacterium]